MPWEGEGGNYDDEDRARDEYERQRKDHEKCQGGNTSYCSYAENHPVETFTFITTGLVGGPLVENFILGGGAAAAAEAGFWGAARACIGSAACRLITGMAGGAGYASVDTPYGPAYQSTTQQALQARQSVQGGANLYKMGTLGPSNGIESQFWSLENPLLNPRYANQYGVPPQNVASDNTFLLVGQLKDAATFITREAPGYGANTGGSIEIVVQEYGVRLLEFIMP